MHIMLCRPANPPCTIPKHQFNYTNTTANPSYPKLWLHRDECIHIYFLACIYICQYCCRIAMIAGCSIIIDNNNGDDNNRGKCNVQLFVGFWMHSLSNVQIFGWSERIFVILVEICLKYDSNNIFLEIY